MNVKKILFPTDFSHSSDAALRFASSLAAEWGAKLDIVHVGNDTATYLGGYYGAEGEPDLSSNVERANRLLLEKTKPTVPNVAFENHYLLGAPEHEILAFADREDVDLIVIGSHGRTGIFRVLLGSVAETVVRRATCPVLTVKQPTEKASDVNPVQQEGMQRITTQPNEA